MFQGEEDLHPADFFLFFRHGRRIMDWAIACETKVAEDIIQQHLPYENELLIHEFFEGKEKFGKAPNEDFSLIYDSMDAEERQTLHCLNCVPDEA